MLRRGNKQRKETVDLGSSADEVASASASPVVDGAQASYSLPSPPQLTQQQQQQQHRAPYGHMPTSSSYDAMPPPQQQQQQQQAPGAASYFHQQQRDAGMGRSQSALNFLLSKAKAPFTSTASSGSGGPGTFGLMNPSASMSSLASQNEEAGGGGGVDYAAPTSRARVTSNSNAGVYQNFGSLERGSVTDFGRYPAPSRPSVGEDPYGSQPVSSPTKRSFFGGHRDRKASNASLSRTAAQSASGVAAAGAASGGGTGASSGAGSGGGASRSIFPHSPLGKGLGLRQDSTSSYAQFSKSQSDLSSRAEFPSPGHQNVDLPRVYLPTPSSSLAPQGGSAAGGAAGGGGGGGHSDDSGYLRSPSPHIGFSRSVDDLSQPSPPAPGTTASSLGKSSGTGSGRGQATWGEHGVPTPDWGRPSDVGAMSGRGSQPGTPTLQQQQPQQRGQIPFSTAPQSSAWPQVPPIPPQHLPLAAPANKHQRKTSKLSTSPKDAAQQAAAGQMQQSRGGSTPGGAASAQQQQQAPASAAPTSALQKSLPAGASYQGFVNRNTNISLSLAQLSEGASEKGKEREKDVSKGWKAYRVVLREDKLYFFKPPSGASDDVKALFPTTIVRGDFGGSASKATAAHFAQALGLDADALKRGLGTQELLAATASKGTGATAAAAVTTPAPRPLNARRADSNGPSATTTERSLGTTDATSPPSTSSPTRSAATNAAWAGADKHADLILVDEVVAPRTWAARIASASPEGLAHELVFATQRPASNSAAKDELFVKALLIAQARSGRPMLALLVALQKWVGVAMTLQAGDTLRGEKIADAAAPAVLAFHEEVRQRVALVVQARPAEFVQNDSSEHRSIVELLESLLRDTWETPSEELEACVKAQAEPQEREREMEEPTDWLASIRERASRGDFLDLARHRFSPTVLVKLDPAEVAQQIQVFHAERARPLLLPDLSLGRLAARRTPGATSAAKALLSFDSTRPHMLTHLVLEQIFEDAAATAAAAAAAGNGASAAAVASQAQRRPDIATSAPRQRAAVVRHWIAIASFLLSYGDLAGWAAICAALCCRAVARLDQTWRYVALNDRNIIGRIWAPQLAKLGWTDGADGAEVAVAPLVLNASAERAGKPEVTTGEGKSLNPLPFLGNALVERAVGENNGSSLVFADALRSAERVTLVLNACKQQYPGSSDKARTYPGVRAPLPEYQRALQSLLELGGLIRQGAPPRESELDLARYIPTSLQAEPRSLGHLDLRWRPPQTNVTVACALAPLIFSEALPNLTLVDRERVLALVVGGANGSRRGDTVKHSKGSVATLKGNDPEATVSARAASPRFPMLNSPLARSRTFPPGVGAAKQLKGVPYAGIIEWGQGTSAYSSSSNNNNGGVSDETLIRIGSELIFGVVQEPAPSVPSSPMTSKRFSQEMSRGSRPLSQVSKRSSLPASNRSSVVEMAAPLHVVVKAATLERLVDVLVLGVQHLTTNTSSADDLGEAPLSTPRKARLQMDSTAFRSTFLATFRRICAPLVLFDFLIKRFSAAVNASREMALPSQHRSSNPFPSWTRGDVVGARAEPVDWDMATRIRLNVISVLRAWATRCPQDFADDVELYNSTVALARDMPGMQPRNAEDPDFDRVAASLQDLTSTLRTSVMCTNVLPPEQPASPSLSASDAQARNNLGVDIDFDRISPADLVAFLESIATVFFDKVIERDFLIAAELFEHQAATPTGWHTRATGTQGEEAVQANNMYKLLEQLRQPGESREAPSLHQRLPPALRDACAAQNLLRGWIAIHIIEARIGLERRQARLTKLLDAVWICRARMARVRQEEPTTAPFSAPVPFREPTIASFVESVIVGSLTASESRIFVRAWQGLAVARESSGETFEGLFPPGTSSEAYDDATSEPSTPDVGWVLKALAEAVTRTSDLIQGDSTLIDFDKSRTVWNLIDSSMRIRPAEADARTVELAGARLNAMQAALRKVSWDRRAFKDDAAQEAATAPPLPPSRVRPTKPLVGFTSEQQEKHRRDRIAFDLLEHAAYLEKQASRSQASSEAGAPRGGVASPVMPSTTTAAASTATTQLEKRARRMTALFRGAIRPSDKPEPVHRSVAELLDLTPIQKPSLVIGLGSAQIAAWGNTQRSHVFHLASPEGGNHLLQAPTQGEMAEWFREVEKAAKQYALARHSEVGKAGKGGRPAVMPLYGIEINTLAERDKRDVPLGLERMLAEVEARGLLEQGIYRISGAKSAIEGLKVAFSKQPAETIDLTHGEFSDIHAIAGAIKQWFRELPEPPIPYAYYNSIIEAERIENHEARLYAIRDIIWDFPKPHFDVLRRISEHLARVCEEGERNLMAPHNIGLVFGTSLLNPTPGPSAVATSFGNIGKAAHIVKLIITTHDWLFEPEPEAEAEPEVTAAPGEAAEGAEEQDGDETQLQDADLTIDASGAPVEGGDSGEANGEAADDDDSAPPLPAKEFDVLDDAPPSEPSLSTSSTLASLPSSSTAPMLPPLALATNLLPDSTHISARSPRSAKSSSSLGDVVTADTEVAPLASPGGGGAQRRAPGAREATAGREESIYLDARDAINLLEEPLTPATAERLLFPPQ